MDNTPLQMIPIVAIIIGGLIAVASIYYSYRKRHLVHHERLTAIEKGADLPPLELEGNGRQISARGYLLRGLVWLAVGIGIMLFFGAMPHEGVDAVPWGVAMLGSIPALIGAAYLVFYAVEGKRLKEEEEKKK